MLKKADINESRRRILVIDDDSYITEFFGAFFNEEDVEVRVASDIEVGRREVKAGDYDVLFLDVHLPGADGLEMLGEVKVAVDIGKVVVITGEVTEGLKRRVASLGIERCLGKPFDLGEIREIVSSSRSTNPGNHGKLVPQGDISNENVTLEPNEREDRVLSCKDFENNSTKKSFQDVKQQRKSDWGPTR
jgi:DNA-binding response OmpR family regulator